MNIEIQKNPIEEHSNSAGIVTDFTIKLEYDASEGPINKRDERSMGRKIESP